MRLDKAKLKRRIRMRFPAVILALVLLLVAGLIDFRGYRFINILLVIGAAISLTLAFVPSLSLRQRSGELAPDLDENGMAREKIEKLIEYVREAQERIYIVAGEFHPSVFNDGELGQALKDAAERGVDVQIIIGDRARSLDGLKAHILKTNKDFLEEIKPCLRNGCIKIYTGPRERDHFHILDRRVIVEERHHPGESSAWHYRENTWVLAEEEAAAFLDLARKMNLLTWQV